MMWVLMWMVGASLSSAFNLLTIGDSFDGHFLYDWCTYNRRKYRAEFNLSINILPKFDIWDEVAVPGVHRFKSSTTCTDPYTNNTLALLRIYGSSAEGPYQNNYLLPVCYTKRRLIEYMAKYFDIMDNIPDRIIFHTTKWDQRKLLQIDKINIPTTHPNYSIGLETFERDTNERLDDLCELVNTELNRRLELQSQPIENQTEQVKNWPDYRHFKIDIGMRTTTHNSMYNETIVDLNKVVHKIAKIRNLTFYDMDRDIWEIFNYQYSQTIDALVFRDKAHIKPVFSHGIVHKLMGLEYNKHIHFCANVSQQHSALQSIKNNEHNGRIVLNSFNGYDNVQFKLLRAVGTGKQNNKCSECVLPGTGPLFYSAFINNTRYKWIILRHHHHNSITGSRLHSINSAQSVIRGDSNNSTDHSHVPHNNRYNSIEYDSFIMSAFQSILTLSPGDIALASDSLLKSVPSLGVMPVLFNTTQTKGFVSCKPVNLYDFHSRSSGNDNQEMRSCTAGQLELFVVSADRAAFQVNNFDYFSLLKLDLSEDVMYVDYYWIHTYFTAIINNVPHFYTNHDVLIRLSNGRSIQLIANQTRHSFKNGNAFISRGYDFDNVVTIDIAAKLFIDAVPLGDVLV